MILVREVFQLKFGKAKEAKALWKERGRNFREGRLPRTRTNRSDRALLHLCGGNQLREPGRLRKGYTEHTGHGRVG